MIYILDNVVFASLAIQVAPVSYYFVETWSHRQVHVMQCFVFVLCNFVN